MMTLLFTAILNAFISSNAIDEWSRFEVEVRDQSIARDSALKIFPEIYRSLLSYSTSFSFTPRQGWRFPLKGYRLNDVGKGGFKPGSYYGGSPIKGYNFFDGNRHGGHPAYDIFIHDTNFDGKDDKNGQPAQILAPQDMVVLSVNTGWKRGSDIRGGNYIWALIPDRNLLLYFAHLDTVAVAGGCFVQTGDIIGTVGRTGKNAELITSKTHLHMMVLSVDKSTIKPIDFLRFFSPLNTNR